MRSIDGGSRPCCRIREIEIGSPLIIFFGELLGALEIEAVIPPRSAPECSYRGSNRTEAITYDKEKSKLRDLAKAKGIIRLLDQAIRR